MTTDDIELQLLQVRQRCRLAMLRHLYRESGASTRVQLAVDILFQRIDLTAEAARASLDYLVDEGLAKRVGVRGVGLTHAGLVEWESVLQKRPTEHFSLRIIQHFHGAVGAVQNGPGATANVEQE